MYRGALIAVLFVVFAGVLAAHRIEDPNLISASAIRPAEEMVLVQTSVPSVPSSPGFWEPEIFYEPQIVRSVALIGDSTAFNIATALDAPMAQRNIAYSWTANAGCAFVDPEVEIVMNITIPGGSTTCPNWKENVAAVADADVVVFRADGTPLADMLWDGERYSVETGDGRNLLRDALDYISEHVTGELVIVKATPLNFGGFGDEEWVINRAARTLLWNEVMAEYADRIIDLTGYVSEPGRRHDGAHIASEYRAEYAGCLTAAILGEEHSCI